MKYKFEIWKYSHLNTKAAETLLNKRSEKGWNLKKASFGTMVFERTSLEQRKKYMVDFVPRNWERGLGEESVLLQEFYEELGWTYVGNTGGGSGVIIFEASYHAAIKEAYVSNQERRENTKARLDKGDLMAVAIGVPLLLAVWIWQFSRVNFDVIYLAPLVYATVIITMVAVIPAIAQTLYITKENDISIKLADWATKWFYYFIGIMAIISLMADIYLIITGQFGAMVYGFWKTIAYLSLIAIPLYCIGKGLQLLGKSKATIFIGGIMWLLGIAGAAIGILAIPLQLGWIS